MSVRFFPVRLVVLLAISVFGSPLVGHAGLFDDMQDAIDTVREGTETVEDAKSATKDAKDLLPESETKTPPPSVKSKPPPLPPAAAWHVSIDGESAGPFDTSKIGSLISRGEVTRDSLVWKEGMNEWAPAKSVKEISPFFAKTPPPLPPN